MNTEETSRSLVEAYRDAPLPGGVFTLLSGLLPLAITLTLYFPVLGYQFVWDDTIFLQVQLPAFQSIGDTFFPGEKVVQLYDRYYRPLIFLSYLWDRGLWQFNPMGYHLTVLVLHLGSTLLVFFLARRLFKEEGGIPWGALAASLLFGLHPVHTESVAWMSGRTDVMAAFFMIASVLFLIRAEGRRWSGLWFFGSSLSFFLALLSKETAVSLLLIYLIFFLIRRWEGGTSSWLKWVQYLLYPLATLFLYFLLRREAVGSFMGTHPWVFHSPWEAGERMFLAFGFYLGKFIWPFHLSAFIHDLPASIPHFFLSLFLMGGLILLTVYGYFRRQYICLLGGGWILATLFPSVLISLTDVPTPVAERYLYIPSVGLVLLVGSGVQSLLNRKRELPFVDRVPRWIPLVFTIGLVCVLLGGAALLAWVRLPVWKNNLAFWRDAAQKNPAVWLPHQNLGIVFSDLAMFPQAEEEFRIALGLTQGPTEWSSTMTSLGIASMGQGKSREAEKTLLESLRSGVESPFVYYALGYLYTHEKEKQRDNPEQMERRFDLARSYFQKAIALNPYYAQAYLQLGDLEMQRGNDDQARAAFERMLGLASGASSPMMEKARGRLASIHFRRGNRLFNDQQIEMALEEYRQSLGYNPRFAEAHFNLAVGLSTLGRSGEAIGEYRMVIQENPRHAKAHFNLAHLLEREGQIEDARGEYNTFLASGEGEERFRRDAEERLQALSQEQ